MHNAVFYPISDLNRRRFKAAEHAPSHAASSRNSLFPNEEAITRLIGAILLEQNGEWAVQRGRYMSLETIAPLSDDPIVRLPAVAA